MLKSFCRAFSVNLIIHQCGVFISVLILLAVIHVSNLLLAFCRYALNEMDKFSLKDSGRGDSEAGDSDYEPGRESPMDRLLGEGFTEIYAPDGQHRAHAGTSQRTALGRYEAKLQSLFCSALSTTLILFL